VNRRDLLKSAAAPAAGLTILKSGLLRGQTAPSNKLNVALIGVWGRGTAHYTTLRNENVVAICDVNELRTKEAVQIFPKAKTYTDWRRLMDQKDVEAVIICTADHHHAFIANWALNRDMHVFCEKPLGISIEEVRTVRANYLKRKAKVATQHGTQRHAFPNFERIRELILDGAIGDLQTVHSWDSRRLPRPGYPAGEGQPPAYLQYEQWIGPSPYHPYSPQYFGGSSGLNCLFWNMYRDFGVGQMGDMGAHTMDLVWNSVDAGAPSSIDIDWEAGRATAHCQPMQMPGLERLCEPARRSLLLVGQAGVLHRREVRVDRANRAVFAAPLASGAAAGVLRPADLLTGFARVVAQQVPSLAPVDPPLLNLAGEIGVRLRLNADGGSRQDRRRRGVRKGVRRRGVRVLHIEVRACREQQGSRSGSQHRASTATTAGCETVSSRDIHQNPKEMSRKKLRLGG